MADDKQNPGVYGGSRVGYLEHEVENSLRERVRGYKSSRGILLSRRCCFTAPAR